MRLQLTHNNGLEWSHFDLFSVKGYAFVDNKLIIKDGWKEYFDGIKSVKEVHKKIGKCNGFFAIVLKIESKTLLIVDHIRSIPLFYSPGLKTVSDSASTLVHQLGQPDLNKDAAREFFSTGYVTGTETLINQLKQAQAGEITVLYDDKVERIKYHDHIHIKKPELSENEYIKKLDHIFRNTFRRLQKVYAKKTIVISLSGGYDSRILIYMCKIMGLDNVICFTYGSKNDKDVINALAIASQLGYPIHFIDYAKGGRQLYISALSRKYDAYAFNYVSIPHIQDFQAIKFLLDKQLIPKDSVVISGHCGDFVSGRHLNNIIAGRADVSDEEIADEIIRLQYSIFKLSKKERLYFKEKILSLLPRAENIDFGTVYENWIWKERMAKFLVNSVRAYEFFNLQWHLPLWDKEIVDFFLELPKKYREDQSLYKKYILSLYPQISVDSSQGKKLYWLRDIKLQRYGLSDLFNMLRLSFFFRDFTKPDRRTIHKLNLARFKMYRKKL